MSRFSILLVFILVSCSNNSNKEVKYYDNGIIKQIRFHKNNDSIKIINYDTLGRELSKYNILNKDTVGIYVKYSYPTDYSYNIEEYGHYNKGEKIIHTYKYFNKITNKLTQKIYFIRLYNPSNNNDTIIYHPNIRINYNNSNEINENSSCYYKLKSDNDTLLLGHSYKLTIFAKCFDFNNMIVIIGNYNKYFKEQKGKYDTLKSSNNIVEYNFTPKEKSNYTISGQIFMYKEIMENNEFYWKGKRMFFHKNFYVISDQDNEKE